MVKIALDFAINPNTKAHVVDETRRLHKRALFLRQDLPGNTFDGSADAGVSVQVRFAEEFGRQFSSRL